MPNLDVILKEIDYALNILFESNNTDGEDNQLTDSDKTKSQRVMRVNHMGEVCAQALYRGQALTTKDDAMIEIINNMCEEEKDHLVSLNQRLSELSGRPSKLNSLWYLSSFLLGAYVGTLEKDKSYGLVEMLDVLEQINIRSVSNSAIISNFRLALSKARIL